MTSMSEAGTFADATPRCPTWCTFPPDHDLPEVEVAPLKIVRREHTRLVLDAPGVAWVELFRLDCSVGADGPTIVGPNLVQVTSLGEDLSASDARVLAEALTRAAELVDQAERGHR